MLWLQHQCLGHDSSADGRGEPQVYYTTPSKKSEGVKGYWCHPCYNEHRGEVIELEGMRVRKVRTS